MTRLPLRGGLAGFTLLEVLIALAILAILMAGLIKITANNIRNLRTLENTLIAEQVAQNRLLALRTATSRTEQAQGEDTMAGRTWHWRTDRTALRGWGPMVRQYRVTVYLSGEAEPYAELLVCLQDAG